MSTGFQILKRSRIASAELVAAFSALPVANVSDAMCRMTAGGAALRPMHRSSTMAGVAVTVKTRPGDNLMVHKAINMSGAGDIIVVDAGGDLTNALIGELMLAYAIKRGIEGIVINGAIRDSGFIRKENFPVYAAGITHRGPLKDGPGEINIPIAISGMVIEPGDIIIGDDDGFLAVPYHDAENILQLSQKKYEAEKKLVQAIEKGTNDRSWVDKALLDKGCVLE
ncbi:RraA family protein [Cocleimonas sp. KMM 6892]|uniref:RraA family protein n=1 Tax=unclassified Cocleimonas TaxID=2639732 RepID=UPI002DB794E5|nr:MULTISPECIES: RraA family protein [unclassified Cocleimonas]MEB8431048.1 RraA family protein [Cocleimonas sp. KMM 6892]MEC4714180.1 RraA family protein [Cocleimonas sp. KMM 6895]MEC4743511.1 RraA family protein [Cocleimonas sp. KMM 6896]